MAEILYPLLGYIVGLLIGLWVYNTDLKKDLMEMFIKCIIIMGILSFILALAKAGAWSVVLILAVLIILGLYYASGGEKLGKSFFESFTMFSIAMLFSGSLVLLVVFVVLVAVGLVTFGVVISALTEILGEFLVPGIIGILTGLVSMKLMER